MPVPLMSAPQQAAHGRPPRRHQVLLALLCCLGALVIARAASYPDRFRYCSDNLNSQLDIVCGGNYNVILKGKRAPASNFYDFLQQLRAAELTEMASPWRSRWPELLLRLRRMKRGIVDECCHKPCSKEEMRAYCGQ